VYSLTIKIWPVISPLGIVSGINATPIPRDWDGQDATDWYLNGSIPPLSAIEYQVNAKQVCFYVVLPVQLYTLKPVGDGFNFTTDDVQTPYEEPNMEVVAVKLKGSFVDEAGLTGVMAQDACGVTFQIISPVRSPFNLTHTYQENIAIKNRPIYCMDVGDGESGIVQPFIPVVPPGLPFNSSLLFTPKCGVGIWTNLLEPSNE
jgi:hypothetical protein